MFSGTGRRGRHRDGRREQTEEAGARAEPTCQHPRWAAGAEPAPAVSLSAKLGWLCRLLWGGSVLLAFEHLWHGELIPWFPFLTAARDPADTAEMLREMGTVGVGMAALITAVWAGMVVVSSLIERRALPDASGRETA